MKVKKDFRLYTFVKLYCWKFSVLVCFRDLLVTTEFELFEKWVLTFTHTVIVQSTQ